MRLLTTTIAIIILLPVWSHALQQQQIDSLRALISESQVDTNTVNRLNKLAYFYKGDRPDSSFAIAKRSYELALELNFIKGQAHAITKMAETSRMMGDYDSGLEYATLALELSEKLDKDPYRAGSHQALGVIYAQRGDYELALEHLMESAQFYEKLGDRQALAWVLNNIGLTHYSMQNLDDALRYYEEAVAIHLEMNHRDGLGSSYHSIAGVYFNKKEYETSLEYALKALEIDVEEGDLDGQGVSYSSIAMLYVVMEDYDKALEFQKKGLAIAEQLGDRYLKIYTLNGLGDIQLQQANYSDAANWFGQAIELAKEIGAKRELRDGYSNMAEALAKAGNYKDAYDYFILYNSMKDSLLNEQRVKQLADKEAEFDTERKEYQIELQQAELDSRQAQIEKKDAQRRLFLFGGALLAIIAILAIVSVIQKRRTNMRLREKNAEITLQKEIIEEKNKDIVDSIEYAKRLQESILPPIKLVQEYFKDSFILYRPKDIVSGDFYWMDKVGDLNLFAAVDCTGHGVPGAIMSIVGHNGLKSAVNEQGLTKPSDILTFLDQLIHDTVRKKSELSVRDGMDLALCSLDLKTLELQYAGANNPLYHVRDGALNEILSNRYMMGEASGVEIENHTLQLKTGDSIYIFSDGYADQFGGPKGKKFKAKQFKDLLLGIQYKDMQSQHKHINTHFDEWRGEHDQIDDICIIGVRV